MPPVGATLDDSGVTFRVWAPGAKQVFEAVEAVEAAGSDADTSAIETELAKESDGYFARRVAGVDAGDAYRFKIVPPNGDAYFRVDPRAYDAMGVGADARSVVHDPAAYTWKVADFQPVEPKRQVIYEMHVGSFEGPTDDASGNDEPSGTFQSALSRLDHVQALGANMIELLPPAEFSVKHSYGGYTTVLPFAPSRRFGTPDDLKAFVDACHARGIGVIIDVAYTHFGFHGQDPKTLPQWCYDGVCNRDDAEHGGAYFNDDKPRRTTPWGNTRPNYDQVQVSRYFRDNARMWLDEYHAHGLRFDATKFVRNYITKVRGPNDWDFANDVSGKDLLESISQEIHAKPNRVAIAEDFAGDKSLTRAGDPRAFDAQGDGAFVHPVKDAITQKHDSNRSMHNVGKAITYKFNGRNGERVVYTESHDEDANGARRVVTQIEKSFFGHDVGDKDDLSLEARKLSTLGAALVFTTPGLPMIFQGQELLEARYFDTKTPVAWDRAVRYAGIVRLYTDLIAARKNDRGATAGLLGDHVSVFKTDENTKLLAYHRWDAGGPGDDVVVIANFSNDDLVNYDLGMPLPGTWVAQVDTDAKDYDQAFGGASDAQLTARPTDSGRDGFKFETTLKIGKYSALILSQKPRSGGEAMTPAQEAAPETEDTP
jgi:1,4-alpha-glucan branching enzyme